MKVLQNILRPQEFYRAGTTPPGFKIPGSATELISGAHKEDASHLQIACASGSPAMYSVIRGLTQEVSTWV